MNSIEFFIGGFLIGVIITLGLCAQARKHCKKEPPLPERTTQEGSATTNAPDQLAKIGRETGAEIFDD